MEEEGTLIRADDDLEPTGKCFFRLYFKGFVSNIETTKLEAGFVVAICGDEDDLLFDTKGSIHDSNVTLLEAELIALKWGLTEAVSMQIKHISICCDQDQIFDLVMERSTPEQENIALLIRDVQGIRKHLTSSFPVLVTPHQVKLAMQTISPDMLIDIPSSNDIIIDIPAPQETCTICTKDDINSDQMFSNDECSHKFCSECVKQHIEARLLIHGTSLVTCLEYQCQSILSYVSCINILTPELKELWEQRMREDLIPVTDIIYCPNPRCSALVLETEFSHPLLRVRRICLKCSESFCIDCKVPWHNNLSCNEYKRLHYTENDAMLRALAKEKMWRQCKLSTHD